MKADSSGIDTRHLMRQLAAAYDLDIADLQFLPLGEEGYSYRADTASGPRYFVKAYTATGPHAALLERAFRLTSWLRTSRRQPSILAPYDSRKGPPFVRYGAYLVTLFAYIDGTTALEHPLTDADWQRVAALLADLHQSAEDIPPTLVVRRDVLDIPYRATLLRLLRDRDGARSIHTPIGRQVDCLLREQRDDILDTLRTLEEAQAAARREKTHLVLTHGDPNLANIILDGDGHLYLIDWGAITLGRAERDLVAFTGPRFEAFIHAYVGSGGQATLRSALFRFYFYHWVLQEISDYGTRIHAGRGHTDEVQYYWHEFQRYMPIRHDEVASGVEAVRDVLREVPLNQEEGHR